MLDCAQRSGPTVLVRHALTCRYWCMYISTLGCPFNFAIFLLLTNYSFTLLLLSDLVLSDPHFFWL